MIVWEIILKSRSDVKIFASRHLRLHQLSIEIKSIENHAEL